MKSSLKFRVTLFLAAALIVVIGSFLFVNNRQQHRTVADVYDDSSREIVWAISRNIELMMLNGSNEEIQPEFEQMQESGVVKEISVVNEDGIIRRSSNKAHLDKETTDQLWRRLLRERRDSTVVAEIAGEPAVVTYKVFENTKACQDCHDIDATPVIGGMKLVKSKGAVTARMAADSKRVVMLAIAGGLVLVASIGWILSRGIFKPLHQVQVKLEAAAAGDVNQEVATARNDEIGQLLRSIGNLIEYIRGFASSSQRIAAGDLRVEVSPRGEHDVLATSFNRMSSNLTGIVRELADHSGRLVSTASQIAASAEQLSRGAGDQSGEVNRVSTAVEQMTAAIVESSQNAGSASDLAKTAADTAIGGGDIIGTTIFGIQHMAEVARCSADSVGRLAQSVDQIGEVITVIDEIADQTNLLALNAAIEAARAGEQGRGFAVVADEVRRLADRTGRATGDISEMIKAIQGETRAAVDSMQSVLTETEQGRELTDRAGNSLKEIVNMSRQVMEMIQQIATAAEEQSTTAEHIARSVDHISSVTVETANGAAQSASVAEELHRLAEGLDKIVGRFKVTASS